MPATAGSRQHRLERWVHRTLLGGLSVSAGLLAVGLAISFTLHERRPFTAPPPPGAILRSAFSGYGPDLINLGLVVLIGTPVLRVLVLGLGWLLERSYRFAAVAFVVFCLLGLGLVLGFG